MTEQNLAEPIHSPGRMPNVVVTLLLWVLAGLVMVGCARLASASRTQEARVLETAREMLGRPFDAWMIPHTNGEIRLHKPPLAYWTSAGAFKLFGVSAWVGRFPAALTGWLTLGVTYLIARRLFNPMTALFAAGALLGSYTFAKFSLLAETDILATLFVTAGVYCVLRAVEGGRAILWQHLLAICMALAVLAKGPPAAYVPLFYVVLCLLRRDSRPLLWFVLSGAIVTFLVIAAPWFLYVINRVGAHQLMDDLRNSAEGGKGHAGLPHVYVPMFALSVAPWIGMWAVGGAAAVRHVWRRLRPWQGMDSIATLLLWGLIIVLPLMGWGNKQIHYLLPLMPPTMILVGYAIAGAVDGKGRFHDLARIVLAVTAGVMLLIPLVPPIIARLSLDPPEVRQLDWLACGLLIIAAAAAFFAMRRFGRLGVAGAAVAMSVVVMVTVAFEGRVIEKWPNERLAEEMLRVHPDGHFVMRGEPSLPLCFAMRRTIPTLGDMGLAARVVDDKNLVCLEHDDVEPKSPAPVAFIEEGRIGHKKQPGQKEEWLRVFVPIKLPQ